MNGAEILDDLLKRWKDELISDRMLINRVKWNIDIEKEIIERTKFLDSYEDVDILERLYYVAYDIHEVVKCKFCDNKATWFGRGIKEGYRPTCKSKECKSKLLSEKHTGNKIISENRDKNFIEWQKSVTEINDEIVKEHIKYDKFIPLIDNYVILDYLNNRFPDSQSMEETLKRIELGVEIKPICARPGCGKPVIWIGRKRGLFTKYCCDSCRAQSEETHQKMKQTQLERYGTECVYDSSIYQQKMIDKYGVPYTAQIPEVIEKKKQTWLEKYGYDYASQSPEVKDKVAETVRIRYNTDNAFMIPSVFEKAHSEETKEKIRQTNLERYGYISPLSVPEIRNQIEQTNIERYGVPYNFLRPEIQEKAHSEETREKIRQTNLERYGYESPLSNPDIREKSFWTMVEQNKLQKSKQENDVYEIIHSLYNDAIRHYRTEEFPFVVDIYIPRYKLFIEYQGSHFHNKRAFFPNRKEDNDELRELIEKANTHRSEPDKLTQYDSIVYTWADLDVRKRELAYKLNLNYLEIYSFKNRDDIVNQIILYICCLENVSPIMYTDKALQTEFDIYRNMHIVCSTPSDINYISKNNNIVKSFQFCEFYKPEMYIYAHNPIQRRKLIQNRMKYLNKKEHELQITDIFRGFKVSGIHYGYSHFNPEYTNWFINKYSVKRIFDPCGGWGHHMLGMLCCEKIYYNDLNIAVANNIQKICDYFNLNNVVISTNDAREYIPNDNTIDAWFMCPPYFNIEMYEVEMFENISVYKEFLNSILRNWLESTSNLFGIIIRKDFLELFDTKPSEEYTLDKPQTHLLESSNERIEEVFCIFKK